LKLTCRRVLEAIDFALGLYGIHRIYKHACSKAGRVRW